MLCVELDFLEFAIIGLPGPWDAGLVACFGFRGAGRALFLGMRKALIEDFLSEVLEE